MLVLQPHWWPIQATKMSLKFYTVLLVSVLISLATGNNPCVPKYYDDPNAIETGRMNCECTATYCDTVDEVPALALGEYVLYTSNIEGLRLEQTTSLFEPEPIPDSLLMTINLEERFQSILGFGGAFTDSTGININLLSSGAQENILKSYFSPEGIEYNMARVPIAGSDFSTWPYTYDDVVNDTELAFFNLTSEDFELKIPYMKKAMELSNKDIKFLTAAWTAPPWMKTTNSFIGGFLHEEYNALWTEYLIKFLDAYHEEGIDFWSLSTGNEPLGGAIPVYGNPFNAMGWTPQSQFKWVRENLGPAIRNSQHNQTKIMTSDDQRFMVSLWSYELTFDELAASYIDGFGAHWYSDDFTPAIVLNLVHQEFPNKFILATEACVGDKPWDVPVLPGSWVRGVRYVKSIMQDLDHWVQGWIDWNLALDHAGGPNWANNTVDAPILVDAAEDKFYKQPMFYALGHFSKFVTEGSVRVGITQNQGSGVQSIAFQTVDDSVVIVILNENNSTVPVTVADPNRGNLNLNLSPHSFQTVVYPTR